MKRLLFAVAIMVLAAFTAYSGGEGEDAAELDFADITIEGYSRVTDEGQAFDLQWMVEGEELHVQMAALTEGWIAVGFDPRQMMADANVLIGFVSDGTVFFEDHYGDGIMSHSSDESLGGAANYSDVTGEQTSGATIIRFTIPLDSGDEFDKPLEAGGTYSVIFAYGGNGDDDFDTYHSRRRGSFEITL